ncbi:hypothetical protein K474DRAFT_1049498 [Panus rudis PR-1116 ss-1]|nr:hypothetical protein K474DRAFT_1049498 [Panus rudis PR-1116 ss-1]
MVVVRDIPVEGRGGRKMSSLQPRQQTGEGVIAVTFSAQLRLQARGICNGRPGCLCLQILSM